MFGWPQTRMPFAQPKRDVKTVSDGLFEETRTDQYRYLWTVSILSTYLRNRPNCYTPYLAFRIDITEIELRQLLSLEDVDLVRFNGQMQTVFCGGACVCKRISDHGRAYGLAIVVESAFLALRHVGAVVWTL